MPKLDPLPQIVAHFDWGINPDNRKGVIAKLKEGVYHVTRSFDPGPAGQLFGQLLDRGDRVLAGFDFPIGIPQAYCNLQPVNNAGVDCFLDLLPLVGHGQWQQFFNRADALNEISVFRPFYPASAGRKGQHSQATLAQGLGAANYADLFRQVEGQTPNRNAASMMFWCLGPAAVGSAVIAGWQSMLQPLLSSGIDYAIWPFHGSLGTLLATKRLVVAETYPAEAYHHLGMPNPRQNPTWAKTRQLDRVARAVDINAWRDSRLGEVVFTPDAQTEVNDGFGAGNSGQDPFDAFVGLCSMLDVVLGHRAEGAPNTPQVRNIEGWILGQQP